MSTSKLFEKHFGNTASVDLKHPNTEAFFEELNAECLAEDKQKNCNIPDVVKRSGTLAISWGKYGGFYWHWKYTKRLCLGWIAFTYLPNDLDNLLK
jgi:hypothetical protein